MKKNFFSQRKLIILLIPAAFVIGMFGGKAIAAGSYQVFTPKSYGTFTYDDGDESNNNGHDHDLMIDTSDLIKLSENADCLANTIDEINNNLGGNKLIYNESEDAYYIQYGADSVPKKLGDAKLKLIATVTGHNVEHADSNNSESHSTVAGDARIVVPGGLPSMSASDYVFSITKASGNSSGERGGQGASLEPRIIINDSSTLTITNVYRSVSENTGAANTTITVSIQGSLYCVSN